MDGSNREIFIRDVKLPNGLAINYATNELCWVDAGKGHIACISLDGFNETRVLVENVRMFLNHKVKVLTQNYT